MMMKPKIKTYHRFSHKEICEVLNPIAKPNKVLKSDGLISTFVDEKPTFQDFRDYSLENQLKAGIPQEKVVSSQMTLSDVNTILSTLENI